MKSAEELFIENEEQYVTNPTGMPHEEVNYPTGYVPKDKFIQAIETDRQQVREMIEKETQLDYYKTVIATQYSPDILKAELQDLLDSIAGLLNKLQETE